mmetsp:Transcript_4758/g.10982  ORF Transcript_4758/g.10982 Transcript_4758/m.10982 type:complete len:317 (+) Transcript_4758:76-1026(+)
METWFQQLFGQGCCEAPPEKLEKEVHWSDVKSVSSSAHGGSESGAKGVAHLHPDTLQPVELALENDDISVTTDVSSWFENARSAHGDDVWVEDGQLHPDSLQPMDVNASASVQGTYASVRDLNGSFGPSPGFHCATTASRASNGGHAWGGIPPDGSLNPVPLLKRFLPSRPRSVEQAAFLVDGGEDAVQLSMRVIQETSGHGPMILIFHVTLDSTRMPNQQQWGEDFVQDIALSCGERVDRFRLSGVDAVAQGGSCLASVLVLVSGAEGARSVSMCSLVVITQANEPKSVLRRRLTTQSVASAVAVAPDSEDVTQA